MNELVTLIVLCGIAGLIVAVAIPAHVRQKKSGRRVAGGAAGAFAVLDELFHPSAREARIVAEEREEARAPMPSPEDKPFEGNRVTITIPPATK